MKRKSKILISFLVATVILLSISIGNLIVYSYDEDPYIKSGYVFYIKNKNSGKYLDVQNAKDSIGTNVGQYPFNGTNAQKWKVVYAGDFYYLKTVC
ncbi:MAG: RICIN domain-containing protein, partial [Oscillospiraceae bacterium]